ncbi:MAG: hypothetical protein KZQ93_06620 [Candidatus Thiodiazotropha sp. (ex Monitilora ramsayi)]|nr:hypothetical protein [Candidatus Thiodiazotropha sp. (ex Monitilora ramsayi)]
MEMKAVFKAVTLSFLIAASFQALASGYAYIDIYLLGNWDREFGQEVAFKLSIAALSLHASVLCVFVLIATAFAKKQIQMLDSQSMVVTALWVSVPVVVLSQLSGSIEASLSWSPYLLLIFTIGWATLGLYYVLWLVTAQSTS